MRPPPIPNDTLSALRGYAAKHGRTWKNALRDDWYNARLMGPLHALRNTHGPAWLNRFNLADATPNPRELPVISKDDSHYGLPALPIAADGSPGFIHARTDADRKRPVIKWSGTTATPPAIGSKVTVVMNGIGHGEVLGYFIESSWLGLHVLPDSPPDWFVDQNKEATFYPGQAMVFGAEVSY